MSGQIFISYSRTESTTAELICRRLRARGRDCFLDVDDIRGGAQFPEDIARAIEQSSTVLALWSPSYFLSEWCQKECAAAHEQSKLLPILVRPLDPLDIPSRFRATNFHSLTDWAGDEANEAWRRLLRDCGVRLPTIFRDEIASLSAVVRPHFVRIPAGAFLMGSPPEQGADNERPQRLVTFDKPFGLGIAPVTFDMWDAAIAAGAPLHDPRDSYQWGRGRRPVIDVSRADIAAYLNWLNAQLAQWVGDSSASYRLPSEAEWEYACRAGSVTAFSMGNMITPQDALYMPEGSRVGMKPVMSYAPNAFGLHDMHGLVWEHVADTWRWYPSDPTDGRALSHPGADGFVARGGALDAPPGWLRSAFRLLSNGERDVRTGFRIAKSL